MSPTNKSIREEIIQELHKPLRKNFPRKAVTSYGIDDLWQADLVEMDSGHLKGISKFNKGMKYLLTVIDVFSKYAWAIPVKDKSGESITSAFKGILQERKPKHLQTDNGKEFYNKHFKELMKLEGVNHYSTFTEVKASVVERFNRTLKERMWKQFALQGNQKWVELLPKLVYDYNNRKHRTIGMKPVDVNEKNAKNVVKTAFTAELKTDPPKFKIGDKVRISKLKGLFEKGYTANWSTEIFEVTQINNTSPTTYKLKDTSEEEIKGSFYEQELQKTKYPDVYLVEKVLRKKGDKVYVKWLGFDSSHNSWVHRKSVVF